MLSDDGTATEASVEKAAAPFVALKPAVSYPDLSPAAGAIHDGSW